MKFLCYNNQAVIEPAVRHGPGTSYGGVAQLGERTVRIRKVKGSNPSVSTKQKIAIFIVIAIFFCYSRLLSVYQF